MNFRDWAIMDVHSLFQVTKDGMGFVEIVSNLQ